MECKTIAYNPGEVMSKEFAIEALIDIKRANKRMFLIENSKLFTDENDYEAAQQILDGIIEFIVL